MNTNPSQTSEKLEAATIPSSFYEANMTSNAPWSEKTA